MAPRVLLVADRPGWAIDRKAQNLRRQLAGSYDLTIRYQHEVSADDVEGADLVLVFYWLQIAKFPFGVDVLERRADRLLLGICSQFELDDEREAPGLDALRRLPRAVFANNATLVRRYAPLLDCPVYETPNGVDTSFFTPGRVRPLRRRRRPDRPVRVGWAGSLLNQGADHRGVDAVIRPAVAQVGVATFSGAIREERWRDAKQMRDFYRRLDVYVCASRSEGTPNPCLEAAACGVPLVTTPVGAMPELVRHGENGLFHDGTVADLTERLTELATDPAHAAALADQMRLDVRSWDWSVMATRYAAMFADVLGEQQPPEGSVTRLA